MVFCLDETWHLHGPNPIVRMSKGKCKQRDISYPPGTVDCNSTIMNP